MHARMSCERGSLQSTEEREAGRGDVTLSPAAVSHYWGGGVLAKNHNDHISLIKDSCVQLFEISFIRFVRCTSHPFGHFFFFFFREEMFPVCINPQTLHCESVSDFS